MKKKRPLKKVSGSKFLYTGNPSELNTMSSKLYAQAILLIAIMLIGAAIYREYFRP